MNDNEQAATVVRQFSLPPPIAVDALPDAGGFSGTQLWRVTAGGTDFCLRQWPESARADRLAAIFRVVEHVQNCGVSLVPRPIPALGGREYVVPHGGSLWSLETWMPGQPVHGPPSPAQVANAARALARFHLAAASYPGDDEFPRRTPGPPEGLKQRVQLAESYWRGRANEIKSAPLSGSHSLSTLRPGVATPGLVLTAYRERLLNHFFDLCPRLLFNAQQALSWIVPQQICLRDVWSAHVLFTGDEVTGLIDFDAMRVDSVATDLARLLGSFAADDLSLGEAGVDAYHDLRPLSPLERRLVEYYDRFAVLLTGLQWLDWILLQDKQFELGRVVPRLSATISRFEHLSQQLRTGSFDRD